MKRKSIVLIVALVFVMSMAACVHKVSQKPFTALDYTKVTMNTNAQLLRTANALIKDMPNSKIAKVRAAYPKAEELYAKAWPAEMTFTKAVKLWEVTQVKPANLDALKEASENLVDSLANLLHELGVWK